jgi:hypothetical protein
VGELNSWRWGAYAGIAFVVLLIVSYLVFLIGAGAVPSVQDTSKFADFMASHVGRVAAFVWIGSAAIVALVPFNVSVRQMMRAAKGEWEWAAGVGFAAGISFAVLALVHFGLYAAAIADTTVKGDAAAVKALFLSGAVIGGTIQWLAAALLMVSVSYLILQTGILPRWSAWVGYVGAALNLIASLGVFGGGDTNGFFTATGLVGFVFGVLPFVVWVASVSTGMLDAPQARRIRAV